MRAGIVIACLLGFLGAARAELRVPGHRYQVAGVDPIAGWTAVPTTAAFGDVSTMLAGYRHPASNAILAITRVDYPNPGAWRSEPSFFAHVEAGVRAASAGYKLLFQHQHRLDRVPALDLRFRRRTATGPQVVLMRFLFFRRYSLCLVLATPAPTYRQHKRRHRMLVDSFVPYFGS